MKKVEFVIFNGQITHRFPVQVAAGKGDDTDFFFLGSFKYHRLWKKKQSIFLLWFSKDQGRHCERDGRGTSEADIFFLLLLGWGKTTWYRRNEEKVVAETSLFVEDHEDLIKKAPQMCVLPFTFTVMFEEVKENTVRKERESENIRKLIIQAN